MTSQVFPANQLTDLTATIFKAVGCNDNEADVIAKRLVNANLSGHDSHGIIRIAKYVDWIEQGGAVINQEIDILTDNGSVVVVDGKWGMGQSIGEQTMNLAIERAREHGVAVVALRNSGHLGRIGDWPEMAVRAGMLSVHFVNTSGMGNLVAPWGGKERRLSANPFAAGVPVKDGPPLILDMSACTVAEGKIRVAMHAGKQVPENCLIDSDGNPTTDPVTFYGDPENGVKPGSILPIAGHKGYALSIIIEMMAGALTGGSCTNPDKADRLANGMLTIVMDRSAFMSEDEFYDEVSRYVDYVKSSAPIREGAEIIVPGEFEARTRDERNANGIELAETTMLQINEVCQRYNLDVPFTVGG